MEESKYLEQLEGWKEADRSAQGTSINVQSFVMKSLGRKRMSSTRNAEDRLVTSVFFRGNKAL